MKKIIAVLLGMLFITGVSARPAAHIGGFHGTGRTTVIINGGYYNPFYSPFGFYYDYPFYPYASMPAQPTKLDLQIEGIKNDYSDKIKSARMDDSLTRQERRQIIRNLRSDRNNAILDAKKNYYKS